MDFPDYDFQQLNETDIREEIVAPLLRYLGYRSGTEHNVIREQSLSYPKSQLGRKKNTDPILRGRADYICEAHRQIRWVIEAKCPDAVLDQDAEEQSWSYANHPEIRAIYFCLTNGREIKIYQTNRGPEETPIFQCNYNELESSLTTMKNILSPESLLRDYPDQEVDTGMPIGPGLRTVVRITNGSIAYHDNSLKLPHLTGLVMSIMDGSVERNEDAKLEAYIETMVPYQSLQRLNEKLGLHSLHLISTSETVSCNPEEPTIFTSATDHILPQGEMVLDLATWTESPLPINIHVNAQTKATGYLEGNTFHGEFEGLLNYREVGLKVSMTGEFNVHLA
ncbi:MAG: hypothetical protein ABW168_02165 [Sedimenticola sp.]